MENGQTSHSNDVYGREYLVSKRGLLRIAEIVCDIVILITASVVCWSAGGWLVFSTSSLLYSTLFFFSLHYKHFPQLAAMNNWPKVEFSSLLGQVVVCLINAIVSASLAWQDGAIVACTVFAFFALALYTVDSVLAFMEWRRGTSSATTTGTATTTPSTVTTIETDPYGAKSSNANPYASSNSAFNPPPPVYSTVSKPGDLSAY